MYFRVVFPIQDPRFHSGLEGQMPGLYSSGAATSVWVTYLYSPVRVCHDFSVRSSPCHKEEYETRKLLLFRLGHRNGLGL